MLGRPFQALSGEVQQVGDLMPGARRTARWLVCATAPGGAIGLVGVAGSLDAAGGFSVVSDGFVLTAAESQGRSMCDAGG